MIRIGFFGTPSLAATVLEDLYRDPVFDIVFVVTNPDKPFGRDQIMKASPVKELALTHDTPVLQPTRVRGNVPFLDDICSYDCDYFIVVAYGKILPLELLQMPTKMCINVHGSLLPAYRGASPIQAALLHGEKETGVTIMQMSDGMDEGDMLKVRSIAIDPTETSESLFAKFATLSGPTLIDTLRELEHGGITPLPQDASRATYCTKIDKEDGLIDWNKTSREIYQMWQAYTPWPGIYTMYEGKRLLLERVSESSPPEKVSSPPLLGGELYRRRESEGVTQKEIPNNDWIASLARNDGGLGQVVKLEHGQIGVICSEGILTIQQVKLEGKKSQSIKDFVNGNQKFISYQL